MARSLLMQSARTLLVDDNDQRPKGTPWAIYLHTMVNGNLLTPASARQLFSGSGTKPTFYNDRELGMHQTLEVNRRGVCNWQMDRYYRDGQWRLTLSVESEDEAGDPIGPYTDVQLEATAMLIAELNEEWDIPIRRPEDPYDRGVGYHSLFGLNRLHREADGVANVWGFNYWDGPNRYIEIKNPHTKTVGKTCPAYRTEDRPVPAGGDKISQHDDILARARELRFGSPTVVPDPPPVPPTVRLEAMMLFQPADRPHIFLVTGGRCVHLPTDARADITDLEESLGMKTAILSHVNAEAILSAFGIPYPD